MMMMNFSKQTRCLSQAAQSLLTNFEQSAFAPNATVAFGSANKLHRVPFSGTQSATDFFANLDSSLSKFAVAASNSSGDDASFSAVLQIGMLVVAHPALHLTPLPTPHRPDRHPYQQGLLFQRPCVR